MLPVAPVQSDVRSTPEPRASSARYSEYAEIGNCWEATFLRLRQSTTWSGSAPVDCNADHQTYTYFVGELATPVEGSYSGVSPTDRILDAASDLCGAAFIDEFHGEEVPARLTWFSYPPKRAEWDAGEHRIRCDLVLLSLGDDYLSPGTLDDLPDIDDLEDAIDDGEYDLCLTGEGVHPYDEAETEIVDCAVGDYYWRLDSFSYYDAGPGEPFPGEDVVDEYAWQQCDERHTRDDEEPFYYSIDEESWNLGYRFLECWFSTVGVA